MKTISIIIFYLLINLCYCQEIENKLLIYQDSIIKDFSERKIDEYLFLSNNCPNYVSISNDGFSDKFINSNEFVAYLIWKQESKIFVKKITNKNSFRNVKKSSNYEMLNFDPFKYIKKHISKIINEKVLPYQTLEKGEVLTSVIPINCTTYFDIFIDSYYIQKFFLETNLENGSNINFKTNNNLKLIELFRILNKEIDTIQK